MSKLLITVLDTFAISGRGLVVFPGPLVSDYSGPSKLEVELKRPDGTIIFSSMAINHFFQTPPPKEYRWGCSFASLSTNDVPIGTEIWGSE